LSAFTSKFVFVMQENGMPFSVYVLVSVAFV